MNDREKRIVSGMGRYVDDLEFPDMVFMVFVGSPYAHARILGIDSEEAVSKPGVIMVITGREIVELTNPLPPQADLKVPGWKWRIPEVYALAVDKVRWHGEPVAAVIAEDENTAREAAELIKVEYEPLPVVGDPLEAMKPGSPKLYDEWEDNIQVYTKFRFGDVNAAFEGSDRILKVSWKEGRASAFPIEGRGCVAWYDKNMEFLTLWGSYQSPFCGKHVIAGALGLPESKVKVIAVDIGGAFGNKHNTWKDPVVALGSMLTNRPVKWFELNREFIVTGPHQRDVIWESEVAIKNDGKVLGVKARVIHDLGVESTNKGTAAVSVVPACCAVPNAYRWTGMEIEGYGVVTNKSFYCAYRGFGKDKGIKFVERVMDRVARELKMTPEEVRLKNFIQPDEFPFKQINNYSYDSGDYPAILRLALDSAGIQFWREKQNNFRKDGRYLGIGIAVTIEPGGVAVPNCLYGGITQARVKMLPDGTVEVYTDRTEIGQGADESHAVIVSKIIGCNIEDIAVLPVTSDWIGQGPLSSRGAVYCASAVAKAAKMLREKIMQCAGVFLKEEREDLDARDGLIFSLKNPEKKMAFKSLAEKAYFFPGPRALPKYILDRHDHLLDVMTTWYSPSTAETGSTYTTFSSSADVAVVEVDVDTGATSIIKYVHSHDAGRITSKKIVSGQIRGGIMQGIGEALSEELVYGENGNLLSTSYSDYLLPTAMDSIDLIIEHVETPSQYTELGSKGMGEAPIIGSKAAVIAAIEDALSDFGVSVNEAPATRQRVRNWIKESRKPFKNNGF